MGRTLADLQEGSRAIAAKPKVLGPGFGRQAKLLLSDWLSLIHSRAQRSDLFSDCGCTYPIFLPFGCVRFAEFAADLVGPESAPEGFQFLPGVLEALGIGKLR
jgi:hypothetical protein